MTLEIFFEKFDLFADAPNAVSNIRELVLQLAVRGKLVDQDSSDTPASVLLEQIRAEKARLINLGAIKRHDTDPIVVDETPFCIPSSWVWTRLGEIGDWGSGSTPARGNQELYGGGITWLKSGELNDNQALAGSEETVTELALKTGSFRKNQPGDVLLAMYGATIGKAAILAEPAVTNQAVCGCTPFEGVTNKYLFAFLLSQRSNFHSASEGGAQPNISKVKILGFPFPLPPLAEQRRIEAKVNELMASCDRLEEQQKERNIRHTAIARASLARFADAPTPANLEFLFHDSYTLEPADLRKTILAIATHGRLVPHDPDDEPADILLQRIQEWRAGLQQWYQLPTESEPLRVEGDIGNSLPRSWRYVRIGEICLSIVPQRDRPLSFSGKIPWVTLPCFRENSLTLNYNEMGLSPDEVARYRLRIVPAGSVLMSCVGRFGLVALPDRDVVPNQQIHGFYFSPELMDGRFLCYTIMAQKDYLEAQSNTTTISYLNKSKCESVPVFLPPIAEQRRIAAKIDHLMVLVDRLETQLAAYQFSAARLMEAFVSELVSVKD